MLFNLPFHIVIGLLQGSPAPVRGRPGAPAVDTVSSAKPSGPRCVVALSADTVKVEVTNASRKACLPLALLIERDVPLATEDNLRAGPSSHVPLGATDVVHCRLKPRAESGGSLKFRCLRTNEQGQLYDDAGELVPAAVSFDAGGDLLDARGEKVLDEDGEPREGDELRVKYFVGPDPPMRYREMFTETVVSRLFWALGIPVDHVYMPGSVHCLGCTADPFGQKVALSTTVPQVFTLASVERSNRGKTISISRSKGFLWFGGKYNHGFGFDEIGKTVGDVPSSRRVEAEVMAIALNLVAYNNTHSYQNDLVCRKGGWDKVTGECSEVVAYVSDVGGSLGGSKAWWVEGMPAPEMMEHPRGDFVTFSHGSVFTDATACTLRYRIGAVSHVSEAARLMMDARIRGRLGREQLRVIFESASIHRMETRVNASLAATSFVPPGAELDRGVQLLWADEMLKRFGEILTGRCPS